MPTYDKAELGKMAQQLLFDDEAILERIRDILWQYGNVGRGCLSETETHPSN